MQKKILRKIIAGILVIACPSSLPQNKFDIILANINRNVLLQYAAGLKTATDPNGYYF